MTGKGPFLVLYTDGGSRGNPGPAAAGIVLSDPAGRAVHAAGIFLGRMTNNQAEYRALLAGLEEATRRQAGHLVIRSDSELIVRQLNGQYRVRHPELKPLYEQAVNLIAKIPGVRIEHVRREQNTLADELANRAMDAKANVGDAASQPRGPAGSATRAGAGPAPAAPSAEPWPAHFVAECTADGYDDCPAAVSAGGRWEFRGATPPGLCVYAAAGILKAVANGRGTGITASCANPLCQARFTIRILH